MNKNLQEIKVHEKQSTVFVDWDYALGICKSLDKVDENEKRYPIKGKAAILILAEYAAIAQRCAWPPNNVGLVVVVCPPSVWFCPNEKGLSGMFIEPYSQEKHGNGIEFIGKESLWDFCSIQARLDGWQFFAKMCSFGQEGNNANA